MTLNDVAITLAIAIMVAYVVGSIILVFKVRKELESHEISNKPGQTFPDERL